MPTCLARNRAHASGMRLWHGLALAAVMLAPATALHAEDAADRQAEIRDKILSIQAALAGQGTINAPVTPAADSPALGAPLSDRPMAIHVLSRMTFGARPGQIDEVVIQGWKAWVKQQLDPGSIKDDELDSRLEQYPSLCLSMANVFDRYRPAYASDPPTPEEQKKRNELQYQVRRELRESVLVRAVESKRQFQEVVAEFWRNHFNVDQNKDDVAFLANHYEEQVIRAHLFGRFEDMLQASAHHPAMLIYLDNIVSQRPYSPYELRLIERYEMNKYKPRIVAALERQRGLNENYARELMELHTLGVDNGYTQNDVTELASVLTGWSAGWDKGGAYGFHFREDVHDTNARFVLGYRVSGKGQERDGEQIISYLAQHPNTAMFIAWKLCRYLVDDDPPRQLVERVAGVFRKSRGDLTQVYEAILLSPEFASSRFYRGKFKTPFEFTVSALRATGAKVENAQATLHALGRMGQPIYQCEDPTGYYDTAEAWLDPGVLIYRWDYVLRLANDQVEGVRVSGEFRAAWNKRSDKELDEFLSQTLLPGAPDARTREVIKQARDRTRQLGLALGSPAFMQQ
ncbi:MAG: DUF1800 domain-containing protein [Phycisphaeraceae bacterium]